jgi:hypothetical protein
MKFVLIIPLQNFVLLYFKNTNNGDGYLDSWHAFFCEHTVPQPSLWDQDNHINVLLASLIRASALYPAGSSPSNTERSISPVNKNWFIKGDFEFMRLYH